MADKTALFMGAHNDELEYCTGGLALLLFRAGWKIHFVCVARKRRIYRTAIVPESAARTYEDPEKLRDFDEQDLRAAKMLGAEKTILGDSDDSFFEATNQSVYLIKRFVEGLQPALAFIHWPRDNHPDHVEASKACFKALSYSSSCEMHAFEAGPFQSMVYFYPDFFVNIEGSMEKLRESLLVFRQPTASGENLYREKRIVAEFRGQMCGFPFAEAYKVLRFPSVPQDPELQLPRILGSRYRWAGSGQYPWGSQYYQVGS